MKPLMLLSLLFSSLAIGAETPEVPEVLATQPQALSTQEQSCKQQLQAYYALDRAKQRKQISGVSLIGIEQEQLNKQAAAQGYCKSWHQLVLKMKRQHPEILDATEEMTGQPSPIR